MYSDAIYRRKINHVCKFSENLWERSNYLMRLGKVEYISYLLVVFGLLNILIL